MYALPSYNIISYSVPPFKLHPGRESLGAPFSITLFLMFFISSLPSIKTDDEFICMTDTKEF